MSVMSQLGLFGHKGAILGLITSLHKSNGPHSGSSSVVPSPDQTSAERDLKQRCSDSTFRESNLIDNSNVQLGLGARNQIYVNLIQKLFLKYPIIQSPQGGLLTSVPSPGYQYLWQLMRNSRKVYRTRGKARAGREEKELVISMDAYSGSTQTSQ